MNKFWIWPLSVMAIVSTAVALSYVDTNPNSVNALAIRDAKVEIIAAVGEARFGTVTVYRNGKVVCGHVNGQGFIWYQDLGIGFQKNIGPMFSEWWASVCTHSPEPTPLTGPRPKAGSAGPHTKHASRR
jgi:hypothetical protein